MRKIDKTKILSGQYKKWEEEFAKRQQIHDDYNSSQNIYYVDVVMNLLHVQMGLCAFTERRLCSDQLFDEKKWVNGKYSNRHPEIFGHLDHFDAVVDARKEYLEDKLAQKRFGLEYTLNQYPTAFSMCNQP